MKCDDALRALSLYEYGELDAPTEENLESHLHACPSCGQESFTVGLHWLREVGSHTLVVCEKQE